MNDINQTHSALLRAQQGVVHAFCGRRGGVSAGLFASLNCGPGSGDAPEAVAENRARVMRLVGAAHLNTLYQVHSADAVQVDAPWTRETAPHADGMATKTKGLALGVLAADCAPVLLSDAHAQVVGACHAGWKGALGGVVSATVAAMEALGADRARIAAAIGPCISQEAYEVGAEFFDRFVLVEPRSERFFAPAPRANHWLFDLPGFVAQALAAAGVGRIDPLDVCTYDDVDGYFSFRRTTHRAESDYGRNLSVIVLT